MAIAFHATATAESITVAEPAACASGDIFLTTIYSEGSGAITAATGFTLVNSAAFADTFQSAVYIARRGGSAIATNWSQSGGGYVTMVHTVYRGIPTSIALADVVEDSTVNGGTSSVATCTGVTTTTACMVFGATVAREWPSLLSDDWANNRGNDGTRAQYTFDDGQQGGAGATGSQTVTFSGSTAWDAYLVTLTETAATFEQEGFRFRNDDGSETTATWIAAQDTNASIALDTNVRLRTVIDVTEDPGSITPTLYYKKSTDSVYKAVPTSAALTTAFGALGAAPSPTTTTSTIDIAYPVVAAGDLILVAVASRLGSTAIDAEGFSSLSNNTANVATSEGTASTEGADAGGVRITVFYKEADGTETGTVTFANAGTATLSKTGRMLSFTKPAWATWDLASVNGKDVAGGTGYSAAMGADPGIAIGDILLAATAVNTDAAAWSAQDVTGTGLASALTTEHFEIISSGGNDLELLVTQHDVTAALTSGVPTYVATASTGTPEGATVLTRIRATGTPPIIVSASANITAGGEATTAQLTAPAGKSGVDFDAGRMWDNENGADGIDLGLNKYTELELCFKAQSPAADTDVYQFRWYSGSSPLDTYTVTPELTIGSAVNDGAATGTITWAGSATGTRVSRGAATGAINWVGSAQGRRTSSGAATGTVLRVGSATGVRTPKAAATGTVTWVGAASGTRTSRAAATGTITWSGTATGTRTSSGAATGAIAWVGAATGDAPDVGANDGAAAGAIAWVGAATGVTPAVGVNDGSAAGAITWVGAATGTRVSRGAAIGSVAWVGVVNGTRIPKASATGTVAWAGSAAGDAPDVGVNDGSAAGTITWIGAAAGVRVPKGAATGTITWAGSATSLVSASDVWRSRHGYREPASQGFRDPTATGHHEPAATAYREPVTSGHREPASTGYGGQ